MVAILFTVLLLISLTLAQEFVPTPVRRQATETTSPLPLTDYQYTYPNLPEQVKCVWTQNFAQVYSINFVTALFQLDAARNRGTTFVTAPRRALIHYARRCS
jgi:hypothetical protein